MRLLDRVGAAGALVTAAGMALLSMSWWETASSYDPVGRPEDATILVIVGVLLLWSFSLFTLLAVNLILGTTAERARPWLASVGVAGLLGCVAVAVTQIVDGGPASGGGGGPQASVGVAVAVVSAGGEATVSVLLRMVVLLIGLAPLPFVYSALKRRPGHVHP